MIRSPGRVMRAATQRILLVTKRSGPSLVLMPYEMYIALIVSRSPFLKRIVMPGLSDIDIDTSLPRDLAPSRAEFDAGSA